MPRRKVKILGVILDEWGDSWEYKRCEPGNGLMFYQGWPEGLPRGLGCCNAPSWVITPELAALHRSVRPGTAVATIRAAGSPFKQTAIKRQRRLLGLDRVSQAAAWWEDRLADLIDLSIPEFMARHQISHQSVLDWRKRLGVERKIGEDYWWTKPEPAAILASPDAPIAWIAETLGISVNRAWNLRHQLRRQGLAIPDRRRGVPLSPPNKRVD